MKNKKKLILGLAVIVVLGAVALFLARVLEKDKIKEAPASLGLDYAKLYQIEYLENNVKLVTDGNGNELLLVPDDEEIPDGYGDKTVIRTPLKNALCCSTTHVGFIKSLGDESLYDTIAGVCTPVENWTIPQVVERMESGKIAYVAQDHWTAGNIEQITELKPDIALVGSDEATVQLCAQLDAVGIPYCVVTEWMEESTEAQLEWMKLFGAFYNLDEEADAIFEEKVARMNELKEKAAAIPESERPVVALGMIYDGIVYTQAGDSATARTIEAAGGNYALKDLEGEGSVQIGLEEFMDKAKDADILLYSSSITYTPDKKYLEGLEPLLTEFKAFKNDTLYVYGAGYYMNSAAVDEKFEDMIAIIHPEMMEGYTLKHSEKLPDEVE